MRPVRHLLIHEPALALWLARRESDCRLAAAVRAMLAANLAPRVSIADARPPDLVLGVTSGAFAGLVRQRGPEILERLQREGWEFTSIRVRVQVGQASEGIPDIEPKQIHNTALKALQGLALGLAPGELRDALLRLARAGQGSSGGRL